MFDKISFNKISMNLRFGLLFICLISLKCYSEELFWTGNGDINSLFDKMNWNDEKSESITEDLKSGKPINKTIIINEGHIIGKDKELKGSLNSGTGNIKISGSSLRTDYSTFTSIMTDESVYIENSLVMTGSVSARNVYLKGKTELHLFEENNPISENTIINLENEDCWLFLLTVSPSKARNYLAQITVGGTPLTTINSRVVPYYGGTVIIPHNKSTYEALHLYSDEANKDIVKSYKGDGAIQTGIYKIPKAKSFTLKRGYMVTISETPSRIPPQNGV